MTNYQVALPLEKRREGRRNRRWRSATPIKRRSSAFGGAGWKKQKKKEVPLELLTVPTASELLSLRSRRNKKEKEEGGRREKRRRRINKSSTDVLREREEEEEEVEKEYQVPASRFSSRKTLPMQPWCLKIAKDHRLHVQLLVGEETK